MHILFQTILWQEEHNQESCVQSHKHIFSTINNVRYTVMALNRHSMDNDCWFEKCETIVFCSNGGQQASEASAWSSGGRQPLQPSVSVSASSQHWTVWVQAERGWYQSVDCCFVSVADMDLIEQVHFLPWNLRSLTLGSICFKSVCSFAFFFLSLFFGVFFHCLSASPAHSSAFSIPVQPVPLSAAEICLLVGWLSSCTCENLTTMVPPQFWLENKKDEEEDRVFFGNNLSLWVFFV